MRVQYLAEFVPEQTEDGHTIWGVTFPDLPGCVTVGKDPFEASSRAEEALSLHLEGMMEDREPLPPASEFSALKLNDHAVYMIVSATLPGRQQRVNVTFDTATLERIDRAAAQLGMTRSGFLADAAQRRIEELRGGRDAA